MPSHRDHILAQLQASFDGVLPKAKRTLNPSDDLLDLGVGSIAALEMAASLEDHYSIRLPEDKLAALRTVSDFIDLVQQALEHPTPPEP